MGGGKGRIRGHAPSWHGNLGKDHLSRAICRFFPHPSSTASKLKGRCKVLPRGSKEGFIARYEIFLPHADRAQNAKIRAEKKTLNLLSFSTNKTKFYLNFSPTCMSLVFRQMVLLNFIIMVQFKIP